MPLTATWIIINIALAAFVTIVVAGTSVLVPHLLHRRHMMELEAERTQRVRERRALTHDQRQAA